VNGVPAVAAKPKTPPVSHSLDDQTLHKLKKGRLPIEGRVDLHGMTQDEAYSLLLAFLHRAHAGGIRYVLIITGKGSSSGGDGILRRAVPAWLSTPAFRHLVSSHDHAARNHGGSGALYVRLRRTRP
ncbi:MAG: DNA mismatch repair protein MutS, partial [Mesorhizobium sp.]